MIFSNPVRLAPFCTAAVVALCASAAWADCKEDLVATQQGLQATKTAVEKAATEAEKCPAYRKHYAAMIKIRDVFARCDKGARKAENAAQLNTSIEGFKKEAPKGCKL